MRIVIAEDSTLFREGLASLLTDLGHEVVGRTHDADGVLATVAEHRPDLAVIDVRMPPRLEDDGARAAEEVRRRHPGVGILLLSQHVETRLSVDLVGAGGFGYLLKDRVLDVDELDAALERIAAGGSVLDPEVVARLMARERGALSRLTPRESEVLALMARGATNATIAAALVLTERTVETHVSRILAKLDLAEADGRGHRRVLAVLAFLEAGRR